ncbi:flagellar basal body P-ring formation chaperone FlgA [Nitrosospira briensis]|uniref:flagellar basal body P-ring formation chaperone FlgA n=1 Tax=Nitrosospira briensis TaxID=35799 RepID=UPI0008EA3C52|nr:flagellar basal body P-ring formation chaperone FlgA [Nitrosospira briensis]SFN70473.1 flagella basal body P-ring formation protein FlgA [Nitrosospira briensis]
MPVMPVTYFRLLSCSLSLVLLLSHPVAASASANLKQDPRLIQVVVLNFLHVQSAGLPGQVDITLGALDARVNLPFCAALEPALPPGSRPWGNTTVIVRCSAPNPWTIYVRATVKVIADYVVSTRSLTQGHVIAPADLIIRSGDLAQLPPGIVTDPGQAIGRALTGGLPFGNPVRQDMLRAQAAVIQNQSVKLISSGRGFSVTGEGKALNNAAEGQPVQVRSASGSLVSGIARAGAIVVVSY